MVLSGPVADKLNIWGYHLTQSDLGVVNVSVQLSCTTFNSRSAVGICFINNDSMSMAFAEEIGQRLQERLGDISTPITPREFINLMSQEWANNYYPRFYYVPSVKISSIVRQYVDQDLIPAEVVRAIAGELDTTQEHIAMNYAQTVKFLINQRRV